MIQFWVLFTELGMLLASSGFKLGVCACVLLHIQCNNLFLVDDLMLYLI